MKPLFDRVIVKADSAEEKTKSGIIIPDMAKEKPQQGTVIAIGPGYPGQPTTVKEGDRVLFGRHEGSEMTVDGQEVLMLKEGSIIAII